ncbi:UV damage repair protein UvrX [Planomicrobium sp. CPCC 101079]|uniref:Y-family DNA polymerase n=1 Tax=Planomicrobium sp. CPCC 101079 TaxID=2599618 RepID=UPI0011B5B4FD|nr:UV damage repair protein UvrX [Planomicrobium sp. CPCC 101079]TWT09190.1 UV damage repair protein UvrX [Planomicrobium sp. CPCC 101079]
MYEGLEERPIICLDMRSFYASCAAVDLGLDPLDACIAVIGNQEQKGSVVLAASPVLKKEFGVRTGTRLFEIPDDPHILKIEPKMDFFMRVSIEITRLLREYVPAEAIHVYSIDESFVDLSGTEKIWGTPRAIISHLQDDIIRQFSLPSAIGLGPNMLLAKLALDLDAKKTGFAEWTYSDVPKKLWTVAPLSKMWGIGSRLEKTLNNMGIFSVGDLAKSDLAKLEEKFGILGNQLYHHAWGIDLSELGSTLIDGQESFGKGQMLYRDYTSAEEILMVLLEMAEDVARRARDAGKAGRTVSLSVGYSMHAFGGGFHRSRTIGEATNDTMKIYTVCKELLTEFYDGRAARKLAISLSKLEDETSMQLSLFEQRKWQIRKLGAAMDALRDKYGSTAVLRAVSYTEAGTARERANLIGGHQSGKVRLPPED